MLTSFLQLTKYHFTLETIDNITLPAYKGSTFHGGFGHALMKISPIWYRYFFEPSLNKKSDWPKPFVMLPPLDELEYYPKEHQFHCDLTLFGEAVQHHAIAQAAMEYLGSKMGLGYEQGKYKIINIEASQPDFPSYKYNGEKIHLHFSTRLRLKANNKIQRQAPEFSLLITRLIGRLKTLEMAYGDEQQNAQEIDQEWIALAATIKISHEKTQWDDWNRFSGRQKKMDEIWRTNG